MQTDHQPFGTLYFYEPSNRNGIRKAVPIEGWHGNKYILNGTDMTPKVTFADDINPLTSEVLA